MLHVSSDQIAAHAADVYLKALVNFFVADKDFGVVRIVDDPGRTVLIHSARQVTNTLRGFVRCTLTPAHPRPKAEDQVFVSVFPGGARGLERADAWYWGLHKNPVHIISAPRAEPVSVPAPQAHDPNEWITISLRLRPTKRTHYGQTAQGNKLSVPNDVFARAQLGTPSSKDRFRVQCVQGDGILVATVIQRA